MMATYGVDVATQTMGVVGAGGCVTTEVTAKLEVGLKPRTCLEVV